MPKVKLHQLSAARIERIKPSTKDEMINDGGGLYLFVRDYNAKEWIFRFTSPVSKLRRKQSLGSYPDTSLSKARHLASKNREMIDNGVDPILQSEAQRLSEKATSLALKNQQSKTLKSVFVNWKKEDLQNRKDKGDATEKSFIKDVFPLLGDKPIHEVTRDHIKEVLNRPLARKSKRQANRLLADLKQFFGYADDEELVTRDPTRRLRKDRVGGIEISRKRVLSQEELIILKNKLELSNLKQKYVHTIYLYLATGCRRTEIITVPLSNIDLKKRNFFIPSDKSKNTDPHNIYLSDFAIKQIKAIKKLTKNETWLLPNRKWDGHLTPSAITKQITDRQPKLEKKQKGMRLKKRINNDSLALPNGHWIIHDLRRTAATFMQVLKISPHIIKKCLNQRIDDKIVETYQRAELIEEQEKAFKVLGEYLNKLIG